MPRYGGNEAYYEEISREMHALGCDMRTAEVEFLYKMIRGLRIREQYNHQQVQDHLLKTYGLKHSAYYTRLKWIRQRYAIP